MLSSFLTGKRTLRLTPGESTYALRVRKMLNTNLTKLYEPGNNKMNDENEQNGFQSVIQSINQNMGSMGICAKSMEYGEVAWRCMDCEKDPTCIICSECFEKGDHTGHRVQLKRNVGGCCDCGDPDAWDPEHFCSDHKGYEQSPEQILAKLPAAIKDSADKVFTELGETLKQSMLWLENYEEECLTKEMSNTTYRESMVRSIHMIFTFLIERCEEVPAFLYIIDTTLNSVYFQSRFEKTQVHTCCGKFFPDEQQRVVFEKEKDQLDPKAQEMACDCTVLDLCLQTNHLLDNACREVVYEFLFKMFQSYSFKQRLILSLAANYGTVVEKRRQSRKHEIYSISVQVFTSAEMSMLLLKNQTLLDNLLSTLDRQLVKMAADPRDEQIYTNCWSIIHDFKYMARPETLAFSIQNTTIVEQLISSFAKVYLCDAKPPRSVMVAYVQEGNVNEELLNLELVMIKVLNSYLKEIRHNDLEKNRSVLNTFIQKFTEIQSQLKDKHLLGHGVYCLPLHRCFGFYFSRLMLFNFLDPKQFEALKLTLPLEQVFRSVFVSNLSTDLQQSLFQTEEMHLDQAYNQVLQGSLGGSEQKQLGSSLVEPEMHQPVSSVFGCNSVEEVVQQVLQTQMQQMSFVHQICSKKWVMSGEYLEYYPTIYFKLIDRLTFPDVANLQMLLCLDARSQLFDFFAFNFGLDSQLKVVLGGLRNGSFQRSDLAPFKVVDTAKLRLELVHFLRLVVQICISEVPFLLQLNPKKGEHIDLPAAQLEKVQTWWSQAMRREAVHLLMLSKLNANIQSLKERGNELAQDRVFEEMLFEVSAQSRDIKNQVTFKLKDEFHGWFDPFYYLSFDDHSQIFQMYEQNQLRDKFQELGLNDVVGDFKGNYPLHEVNIQLICSLARSDLIKVIVPLLVNWLKFRNQSAINGDEDVLEFGSEDSRGRGLLGNISELRSLLMERFDSRTDDRPPEMGGMFSEIKETILRKLSADSGHRERNEEAKRSAGSRKSSMASQGPQQVDEKVLRLLVDQNVGYHCLKLLILILQASARVAPAQYQLSAADKSKLVTHLVADEEALIKLFIEFREEKDCDTKMKDILAYVLEQIYRLSPHTLGSIGSYLGLDRQPDWVDPDKQTQEPSQLREGSATKVNPESKKDLLKRRQTKLMAKMKKKAAKFLDQKTTNQESKAEEDTKVGDGGSQEEVHQCAFCQEELRAEGFGKQPYGNFVQITSSKLLYYSMLQTLRRQQNAFLNETAYQLEPEPKLPAQQEEEKQSSKLADFQMLLDGQIQASAELSESAFIQGLTDQIASHNAQDRDRDTKKAARKVLDLVRQVCNYSGTEGGESEEDQDSLFDEEDLQNRYLNPRTGASSVLTHCKHYSHRSCLAKYKQEQEASLDGQYQRQLAGFSSGEFTCPICKGLSNCLLPSVPLSTVQKLSPGLFECDSEDKLVMSNELIGLLGFYMDALSEVMKAMRGWSAEGKKPKDTLLVEIKKGPLKIMSTALDHFVHTLSLIDIKGLRYFASRLPHEGILYGSLSGILKLVSKGEHPSFPSDCEPLTGLGDLLLLEEYLNRDLSRLVLIKNVSVTLIKTLLMVCLSQDRGINDQIKIVLEAFHPILKLQFIFSVLWRKNSGRKLVPSLFTQDYRQLISQFEADAGKDAYLQNLYAEAQIPVMRKVCSAVVLIREATGCHTNQDILGQLLGQTSDSQELQLILEYLELATFKQDEQNVPMQIDSSGLVGPDDLKPLKVVLAAYRKPEYFASQLEELSHFTGGAYGDSRICMPANLMLITPYFEFNLVELPQCYRDLQTGFYKKKCSYCDQERQDTVTCLLCGETMCWYKIKGGQCTPEGRLVTEGLISHHARVAEGGCSVFLHTSSSSFLLLQNGNATMYETPYRNRYGEQVDPGQKKQHERSETFVIDSEGGGAAALAQMQRRYSDFSLANAIVQQRLNPDSKFKKFLKGVL